MSEERLSFPRPELRRRTARGAIVNGLFLGGAEALVLVQGLIVTVLLGPHAIGLYGIVTTTAMTIVALKRVGIDEAFVQQSEAGQEEEFQRAFTLELALSAAFALAIAASAPLVSSVYGDDRLLWLTLAVAYLPLAFALQAPTWIFFRRMDFVRQRLLQAIVPVVTFCVTVPLAASGVGVWSLVIGPFVGNLAGCIAAIAVSPYRLKLRFDRDARKRYFAFSWPIFVNAVALLVVQQGQVLAFDLDGGLAAAGYITIAFTLTRYADRADQIVATTIYPAICAVARPARHPRGAVREVEPADDDVGAAVLRGLHPVRARPRAPDPRREVGAGDRAPPGPGRGRRDPAGGLQLVHVLPGRGEAATAGGGVGGDGRGVRRARDPGARRCGGRRASSGG